MLSLLGISKTVSLFVVGGYHSFVPACLLSGNLVLVFAVVFPTKLEEENCVSKKSEAVVPAVETSKLGLLD